jgi:hypothetical protein
MASFYISSTFEDLQECRRDVCAVLKKLGHDVISMEGYGPDGAPPLEKCLADVDKCDVYVGIVAWRYGFIPPADGAAGEAGGGGKRKSITEHEYCRARESKKEIWIFMLSDKAQWPANLMDEGEDRARVKTFRGELSERHVVCFFHDQKELKRRVEEAARKRFSGARHAWQGLKERLPRWYVTLPLALLLITLAASAVLAAVYARMTPEEKTEALIKYHIWPQRITSAEPDRFDLPPLDARAGAQRFPPSKKNWDYPPGKWSIVPDALSSKEGSGMLSVTGSEWGVRNDLDGKSLYDFQVSFRVRFAKGNMAAWVLRAQDDRRSGYVFRLERHGDELYLNCWLHTPGREPKPLGDTPNSRVNIDGLCDGDYFDVKATAKGGVFQHQVTIQNARAKLPDFADPCGPRASFTRPTDAPTFIDGYYSHGNIGFFAPENNGEVLIDNFVPQFPTDNSAASPPGGRREP